MSRRVITVLASGVLLALLLTVLGLRAQGYRAFIVHTGSMSPTYRPGDLVIDRPARDLRVGQVITFRHSATTSDVVTHRIVSIQDGVIHTKGDANRTADVWSIAPNQVQGRVALNLPRFGYLAVFLKQPSGLAALMVSVLGLYLLWSLFFGAATGTAARKPAHARHAAPRRRRAPRSHRVGAVREDVAGPPPVDGMDPVDDLDVELMELLRTHSGARQPTQPVRMLAMNPVRGGAEPATWLTDTETL